MHWPRSDGRRSVDVDLRGGAQTSSRRNKYCKSSMLWRIAQRRRSRRCRFSSAVSRKGNEGADELAKDGCNDALQLFIGLCGPGDKISFFRAGLGAGEGGLELPHGPMLCQEMHEASRGSGRKASLSPWTGRDKNGEGCCQRK